MVGLPLFAILWFLSGPAKLFWLFFDISDAVDCFPRPKGDDIS